MKKLSIGIDAHKVSNVIGLAFNDVGEPILHGKVSADLNRTVDAIWKILKKYDLKKEEIIIYYEAGPTGFVLARRGSVEHQAPRQREKAAVLLA